MSVVTRLRLPREFLQRTEIPTFSAEMRLIWFAISAVFWLTAGYDTWMLAKVAARSAFSAGETQGLRDADPNREYAALFVVDPALKSSQKPVGPSKFEISERPAFDRTKALKKNSNIVALNFEPSDEIGPPLRLSAKAGGIVEASRVAKAPSLVFETKRRSL